MDCALETFPFRQEKQLNVRHFSGGFRGCVATVVAMVVVTFGMACTRDPLSPIQRGKRCEPGFPFYPVCVRMGGMEQGCRTKGTEVEGRDHRH